MHAGACLIALLLTTAASAQTPGGSAYHRAPDAIAKTLETPPPA